LLFRLFISLLLLISLDALADPDAEKAEKRLKQIQTEISELRSILEEKRGEQGQLQKELRTQEKRINKVSKELRAIDSKLTGLQKTLAKKRKQKEKQLKILEKHQNALAQLAQSAYKMGSQEPLKLFLNQDNPALVGRTLAYYQYFNKARLERITEINLALKDLREIEQEIAVKTRDLQATRSRKEESRQQLVKARKERKRVLARLSREIRKKGKTLDNLLEDEESLQNLISSINEALSDIPPSLDEGTPFPQLKGKLSWPVKGTVQNQFGQKRDGTQGKLRWNGVNINASRGKAVLSVARGRVAYADWMKGMGLLVIIDHGDGYMTLYGHNESLYVAPGGWVSEGDIIGTVGDSGGTTKPGLYFEIRHNRKPVNPGKWCHGQFDVAGL
jgi:septal ring factor EnvC (AmiA/AmiB activator)